MNITVSEKQAPKAVKLGLTLLAVIIITQIAIIVLKLTGVFDISWGLSLIPLWIILLFMAVVIITAAVMIKKEITSVAKKDAPLKNRASRRHCR